MEHINGGVINYDSGQNDCVFMNLYLAAKLPVNRSFFHDYRGSAGNSIRKDFGISRYMDVSMDITRGYDSMIFYDGFSTDSAFSGNDCTTTSAGVIPHDGVTGYIGFLGGDSIVRNPALSFLTEIFLRLDETAKISRMDILTNIPQGPNTVQPWVLRVNNVGNLVFLIHLASPRSFSFFDFV